MNWWLENFWILLAGMIILISGIFALIMYCICKRLLRQGKTWKISNSSNRNWKKEEMIYENVYLPPLPPRHVPVLEETANSAPQENENQYPYSTIKKVSVPYTEPNSDYDDVDISHVYRN
ncbi:SLP adapter and CSK-interacting membrane protein [Macrotis lagotis]|uniref:SLP adapter and CSK-interacting membrane protein n=1 Tax=Macrotis lagotis TaxID=92651 RepID=UPI003D68BE2A